MDKIELLAPAGNMESLVAALNNGADAVYLGAKQFNARGKVKNFDFDELQEATNLAHLHNAKVYLTTNTLVFDDEISNIIEIVKSALKAGVDAFIVQDIGLVDILKKHFPDIEIHASTQMGINNVSGAKIAKSLGITRVVLSRETPLEEIKKIKQQTNLDIEYFIQGALCVCFSGNCYESGVLFNASGNRGKCLQLCRLPYTASQNGKILSTGYLLSAKDFNMSYRLKELIDAGVNSFKIEGRARRTGYVATVVNAYREIIDNNFKVSTQSQINIKKAYNRGDFTEGYFNGNDCIIDNKIQGHRGVYVGKVINFVKGKNFNTIQIQSKSEIHKNDGLKFIYNSKEIPSISAMDIKKLEKDVYSINTKAKCIVGAQVYQILDTELEKQLLTNKKTRSVGLNFVAKIGHKANLSLYDDFGYVCSVESEDVCEEAKTQALSKKELINQISKMGDTEFSLNINKCNVEIDNVFLRKQTLNEMRRKCLEKLKQLIISSNKKTIQYKETSNHNQTYQNKKELCAIISEKTNCDLNDYDKIVLEPKLYNSLEIENMLKKVPNNKEIYLSVPSLMTSQDEAVINEILDKYPTLNVYGNNLSAFSYNRKVFASPLLNCINSQTANSFYDLGAKDICLNFEVPMEKYNSIAINSKANIYVYAKGHIPLMTMAHCPMKNNFNGSCKNCNYGSDIVYELQSGQKLLLDRYKLQRCYFRLKNKNIVDCVNHLHNSNLGLVIDLTE